MDHMAHPTKDNRRKHLSLLKDCNSLVLAILSVTDMVETLETKRYL